METAESSGQDSPPSPAGRQDPRTLAAGICRTEAFMRRRRLFAGVAVAVLVAAGLSPGAAHAAGGPNLAPGKAAAASAVNGPYVASNVNDGNADTYWEGPN